MATSSSLISSCSINPCTVSLWFEGPFELVARLSPSGVKTRKASKALWPIREYFVGNFDQVFCTLAAELGTIPTIPGPATMWPHAVPPWHFLGPRRHRATRTRCSSRSGCPRSRCLRAPSRHTTHGRSRALTHGRQLRLVQRQWLRHRSLAQGWDPSPGRELGRYQYRPPTPHQGREPLEPNHGRT